MPTNFKPFADKILAFKKKVLPDQFILFQKKIAFELLNRVTFKTPVDTGRARANWQVEVDQIPSGVVDKTDKGGSSTLNNGAAAIGTLKPGDFKVVFIANNLPYIVPLENGSSQQAPQGMLAVSIEEVEQIFD